MATKKTAAAVPQIVGATYRSPRDTRVLVLTHVGGNGKARFAVASGGDARFAKLRWARVVADGLRLSLMPDGTRPPKAAK